ncbi:MAG TPA: hypothetical protein VGM29_00345 [Polyangiaceae bacterium]
MRGAIDKYLARYAEPESRLASAIGERYQYALVVPACDERSDLLEGYEAAARAADGRVLVILVVNGPPDASASTRACNQALWSALRALPERARLADGAHLLAASAFDVLALDRFSDGRGVPSRQGVGLARRIGMDLALALWSKDRLACGVIGSTDADAALTAEYFPTIAAASAEFAPAEIGALLLPFSHVAGGDAAIDRATLLYELTLRYYVLGLASAGSPYAYQSVGSTLAIDAASYALVRGFPRRAAGEDFYLLDKLGKVASLVRARAGRVLIRSRRSERVPFGTGRRAHQIAEQGEPALYHPDGFHALAALLEGLDAFAVHGELARVVQNIRERVPRLARAVEAQLSAIGLDTALSEAKSQSALGAPLRRRIHTWFDALKTLRFIHALRDAELPSLPMGEALSRAPFLAGVRLASSPDELCRSLEALELSAPRARGPALLGQADPRAFTHGSS